MIILLHVILRNQRFEPQFYAIYIFHVFDCKGIHLQCNWSLISMWLCHYVMVNLKFFYSVFWIFQYQNFNLNIQLIEFQFECSASWYHLDILLTRFKFETFYIWKMFQCFTFKNVFDILNVWYFIWSKVFDIFLVCWMFCSAKPLLKPTLWMFYILYILYFYIFIIFNTLKSHS